MQGGKRAGAAYAHKNQLGLQTLELLADMRRQLATMMAESGFVGPPDPSLYVHTHGQNWFDDPTQAWNKQAHQPSMVSRSLQEITCAAWQCDKLVD